MVFLRLCLRNNFFLGMNSINNKSNSASFDCSFCQNIIEICEKCKHYRPDDADFSAFYEELSQLNFLKSEELLLEDDRNVLKTLYKNNEKAFLVCNRLWMKFGHEFFYLEEHTIKFAIVFEISKVKTLLRKIKKLYKVDTTVTVLSKCLFLEWQKYLNHHL